MRITTEGVSSCRILGSDIAAGLSQPPVIIEVKLPHEVNQVVKGVIYAKDIMQRGKAAFIPRIKKLTPTADSNDLENKDLQVIFEIVQKTPVDQPQT